MLLNCFLSNILICFMINALKLIVSAYDIDCFMSDTFQDSMFKNCFYAAVSCLVQFNKLYWYSGS